MNPKTLPEFRSCFSRCFQLFEKKTIDYGTAWRILRLPSLTDQIFIKAMRIRTLEENGYSEVGEGIEEEYVAIVNYCVMALVQWEDQGTGSWNMDPTLAIARYETWKQAIEDLMVKKNTDYGEAWREMRISSLTDLILMKLLRIQQIENQQGKTLVSEGVDAGYMDMANYALFALIRLNETT
jgi:hypothetical protein